MSDQVDLLDGAQSAFYQALDARAELTALSPVFQHVPENTDPPMTIVGDIESENAGTKNDPAEELTVTILTIHRGPGRAALLAIMHQQYLALHGREIGAPGCVFQNVRRDAAVAAGPASDGITYAGVSIFKVLAEPA